MTEKNAGKGKFPSESINDTFTEPIQEANKSAVVVGASLSGLMTGIALAQAGFIVTILERAAEKRRSGAGLQIDSGEIDRTKTAKFLRNLASGGMRSVEAWSSIEFRLRTEAKADPRIDLRYETRVQTVNQDSESAWVVTDKGETFRGEILIGADGHRSTVRRYVAPHKPNATFAGYLIWVAILGETDIPEEHRPSLYAQKFTMPDGIGDFLLGSIIAGEDGSYGLGDRRLAWAWYDNTRNDLLRRLGCVEGSVVRHSLNAPDIPEQTLIELAEQASVRWPQPWLAATLHSIQTRNLVGIPIAEYLPDNLVRGRIALVGDAAHVLTPLTAKGFNTSLQDVATLAECVAKGIQGTAAAGALSEYESRRLKNVREIVESGQSFSRSFGR
ncbi:NAD(P)/FAD-dependent oxidoreductase [Domibacillus sp. DTU_2020_1001157_1_SI_ALB_TIR_016]|uniref:NAD(P)/FAD-dependent oxidoreductase n=1 Tax=Domibacillus sp. DTU_2020_1001157_1_SI_ALB_TIR_016 TaxID=3077789 RepID=UPI0028E232B8|nr:NAD(P)/FAD-dependent oxidoreductase [Domibacillus sp. DTU_2020_1001157_1_SI_ALB_TIR_016]WNS78670.1 NAD(P)/FAD-dependent oxidoreductase [Domibacillus sp. DTU_2020_1001157_1_SI_ALB_TIR_016]